MPLTFNVMMDEPDPHRAMYDEATRTVSANVKECNSGNVCELRSPYTRFKLFVRKKDGLVVGFKHETGELNKLPEISFDLHSSFDGNTRAIWDSGKFRANYVYMLDFDGEPSFDKANGFLVYGKPCADGLTVKIFSNTYFTFDCLGNIANIVIKL